MTKIHQKPALISLLALCLMGCLTEPGKTHVTDCRGAETYERPGMDSTVVMEQECSSKE